MCLKQFFGIEIEPEYKFKPFDKVLVRDTEDDDWHVSLFSKIWDDWLQLTQYFPNKDGEYYEAAYVRYDAYNPQTEVYSGFGSTEVESRAMLLIDLLDKKVLTLSDLNLKSLNRI